MSLILYKHPGSKDRSDGYASHLICGITPSIFYSVYHKSVNESRYSINFLDKNAFLQKIILTNLVSEEAADQNRQGYGLYKYRNLR